MFKVPHKAISSWPLDTVKSAIKNLPDRLRLYAFLGLNAGMTNVDIGALRKDMVGAGYLTRRRVKTGGNENVPTVMYELWPETAALLDAFKSTHDDLWLVSDAGTPLVEQRIVDGGVKT
jgi:hypothetical protein